MYKPCHRNINSFVVNFFLLNKFCLSNSHQFPSINKVILSSTIQDLDTSISVYYARTLLLLEKLSARKPIIKSIKKTLKGKKSYQVAVSHVSVLRKSFFFNFFNFFVYFFTKGMEEKFIKYNLYMSVEGHYYVRVKDIPSLPGMSEEFFRWPYLLDCFFVTKNFKSNNVDIAPYVLLKYFLKYSGFTLLN